MHASLCFLPLIMAGAAPVGPYCGVSINNLTDTPMIAGGEMTEFAGRQLLDHGKGMKLDERDGQTVVITQKGFRLRFEAELDAGMYIVFVNAMGTNSGNNSFYIEIDGKRTGGPFVIPVGNIGKRSMAFHIDEGGRHEIDIVLREGPGSVLQGARLGRLQLEAKKQPMRTELADRHPRLYLTSQDIPKLRKRLEDDRVQKYYKPAGVLERDPPPFRPASRNGGAFRKLGNYALSYLLEPTDEKLDTIMEWLEMAATYPHCGADLDAEYFMEGVAVAYDWTHDDLPGDLRKRVRDAIARQCRHVFLRSLSGRQGGGLSFQQNHYWFAHLSLALGAAAVYGEVPEADLWLNWAWDRYERIALSFGTDGGFHEGPAYWDYSMPTLYMYTDLYEQCTGLMAPHIDEGVRGQAQFRLHHMFGGLNRGVPLEDTHVPEGRPPTKLLLWEAKRYQDPVAMGIARALNRGPRTDRFNLLWLDENIEPADHAQAVPLAKHYEDIETVFARTAWADDEATHIAFVCRPMGGHRWAKLCGKFGLGGTGHNHPEQGHFTVFARGQLLAGDPGYTYKKMTRNHNTILIDGKGQYGDGQMWPRPNPGRAHITGFAHDKDVTIVTGDATSAYPAELGLQKFQRTVVLAGRDLVVVYDRLIADEARTFSWLLHHKGKLAGADGSWTIKRGDAQLTVTPLHRGNLQCETTTYEPQYVHPTRDLTPKNPELNLLQLSTEPTTEATYLVPLRISDAGTQPPQLLNVSNETFDGVRVADTVVAFNKADGQMTVPLPWGDNMQTDADTLVARKTADTRQIVVNSRAAHPPAPNTSD